MTRSLHSDHSTIWLGLFCTILWAPLAYSADTTRGQVLTPQTAEARICNVDGQVSIHSHTRGMELAEVTLQDSLASGDRIQTAKNSIVSMLVGEDTVVNIDQLSEVTIEQTQKYPKVIHVHKGTTSISTKSQQTQTTTNLPVKTLASMVYPSPGTMFRVTVVEQDGHQPHATQRPQAMLTNYSSQDPRFVQGSTEAATREIIETIEVTHGSVEIVPQDTDIAPMTVGEQFLVDITNGKIGAPVQGSGTTYDIQSIQTVPQHTANPAQLRTLIADTQSSQATGLVAALISPSPVTETATSDPSEGNVILPTTNSTPTIETADEDSEPPRTPGETITNETISATESNEKFILATGNPLETNGSTLVLTNSSIGTDVPTNNIELVSLSPGSTLRGISTDPVFSLEDSQTTSQSVFEVPDAALLEASAPLISALSTNSAGTTATQISTNGDAVEVAGGQLIAFLPADALGLIQLDASSLTADGALFDVNGGGILAVSGNLVFLSNGSQLTAGNLVTLSGGSSFGLVGGSLLSGDNSGTATINNSLCSGGGCVGGFVFAPAGNTVTIDPAFQATQGVNVSSDAALVVVNGTGNTVTLGP